MSVTLFTCESVWPKGQPVENAKTLTRFAEETEFDDLVRVDMDSMDLVFIKLPNGRYLKVTTNDRAWLEVVSSLPNSSQEQSCRR